MAKGAQVDSKIPRGKAAFHTLIPALAFLAGGSTGRAIVGATGLVMAISVLGGPRFSLFGKLFTRVLRPAFKIGPGNPEDLAPHKFAESLGAVFLLLAFASFWASEVVGWTITLLVVALAALNWLAGICVGCQMYLLGTRLRARSKAVA